MKIRHIILLGLVLCCGRSLQGMEFLVKFLQQSIIYILRVKARYFFLSSLIVFDSNKALLLEGGHSIHIQARCHCTHLTCQTSQL